MAKSSRVRKSQQEAVILNANTSVTGIQSLGTSTLVLGGTSLTSTEASYLTSNTVGTAVANKALVANANCDIVGIRYLMATQLTGAIQTAAQTKITSVGTLTSLSTSGLIATTITNNSSTGALYVQWANNLATPVAAVVSINNVAASIGTSSSHPLRLMSNGVTRMHLSESGNIGVATTSPGYNLDVNGSINATSYFSNGTLVNLTYLAGATAGTASASKVLVLDSNTSISGINSLSTTSLVISGTSINIVAAYLSGSTPGTAAASKVVVADSNTSIAGLSNVGTTTLTLGGTALSSTHAGYLSGATVGTAVSGKVLIPNADVDVTGLRTIALTGTNGDLFTMTNTTASSYVAQTMTSDTYAMSFGVRGSANTTNPNTAYWYYNGAYRMLMDANGNLSIGTNTFGYKLNVSGSLKGLFY